MIAEEAEQQELSREPTTMEPCNVVSERGGEAARELSSFQRFSVDTSESLHFEPCEDSPPPPTGAEDGHSEDDVFEEGETEVGDT